jgi:hypothetical protein
MTYQNGSIYEGEWNNIVINGKTRYNKRSGMGKYTYDDGRIIDGEWNLDEFYVPEFTLCEDGRNTQVNYFNGTYKGEIKDGKRNGYGEFIYSDGNVYVGEWKNGRKNGHGRITFNIDEITATDTVKQHFEEKISENIFSRLHIKVISFEGQWNDDKYVNGRTVLNNGDMYEGNFKYNKMSGEGCMTYKNGDISEGTFYNNKEKLCRITYHNGDFFEGELDGKKPRGIGTMIYSNLDIYDGEWSLGIKCGFGIMNYFNGDVYEGKWSFDKKSGKGKMKYSNGSSFEGKWKNDDHLSGKYTDTNGKEYETFI